MAIKVACNSSTQGRDLPLQHIELLVHERRRIAGNLHDGPGQLLNIVKLKLGAMMENNPAGVRQSELQEIARLIELTCKQIRSLEYELSPSVLQHFGLVSALGWLTEDLRQSYGLDVSLTHDGIETPLDDATRTIIFRAVRELLINVARHAEVKNAWVEMTSENHTLQVAVRDCGPGFEIKQALGIDATGMGLAHVFAQMLMLGGRAQVECTAESGTLVTLILPLTGSTTNWRKPAWLFV